MSDTLSLIADQETIIEVHEDGSQVAVQGGTVEILEAGIQGPAGAQGIQGIPGPSGVGVLEIAFAFGDATPKNLVVATANKQVYSVGIHIHTAFNGTGAALAVGDSGNTSRLMATTQNDPTAVGTYAVAPNHRYGAGTQLLLTITPGGGASQGAGLVTLQIEQ